MSTNNIITAVRVRCFNSREKNYKSHCVVKMPDINTVEMYDPRASEKNPIPPRKFNFDFCLNSHNAGDEDYCDQERLYKLLGVPTLENCLKGFNSCLFAYGQTGSGKTFSMQGSPDMPGLIPQIAADLFKRAGDLSTTHSFSIECSYLEIYNEQVKDLLNPAGVDKVLKVRNHPKLGVFVEGLKKFSARSADEIQKYIDDGQQVRTIAATQMNATSSRSHAILTLFIRVKSAETETMAALQLVDLAGSERAASTGAEGATLKEGANINKSLSVLGMCLSRLADAAEGKNKGGHVPFRDSQLTWLLHQSLGGNSKTAMISALSPADINYEETLSTLRFAAITKKIKTTAVVNEDPQQKLIRELREQILVLKEEIKSLASGVVVPRPPPAPKEDEDELAEDEDAWGGAGDALPEEVSVDVRRQQLLEELEENVALMTEATMSVEQREQQAEKERASHEKMMAELKAKEKSLSGTSEEETAPKLLLLNEDLRMLRGGDGKPLAMVHTLARPKNSVGCSSGAGGVGDEGEPDPVAVSSSAATSAASGGGGGSRENSSERNTSLSMSMTRGRSMSIAPPCYFWISGPRPEEETKQEQESSAAAAAGLGKPWLVLPAASQLTLQMRLDVIVDFHDKSVCLEFNDDSSSSSSSSSSAADEIVFYNGKPLRLLTAEDETHNKAIRLEHNDRVIIGQCIFRVFYPLAWRAEAAGGGGEETFQDEGTCTRHLELLENFTRLEMEEEFMEHFLEMVFGEEMLSEQFQGHVMSPLSSASGISSEQQQQQQGLSASAQEIKNSVEDMASAARLGRVEVEENLIQEFPRDVRRELRQHDVKDAMNFDANLALKERQEYLQGKQREQEELQKKLEDQASEVDELKKQSEQLQREREEADRKAQLALDAEVEQKIKKAQQDAEKIKKEGEVSAKMAAPSAPTAVSQSAKSRLEIARRVHEYEELRRELMLWKPCGPSDPKDKSVYTTMSEAMSGSKNIPSYLDVRKRFGDECLPRFEGQIFKNRIKTGFFSRGGLHPVTLTILDHFLFYFDAGAGLANTQASQIKMTGFAHLVGCEVMLVADIEKKPSVRIVSASPRKTGQGKTDAHHGLEFSFSAIEQREACIRAIDSVRLPPADQEVAAALAALES